MHGKEVFLNRHPSGFFPELWFPGKGGCTPGLGSPQVQGQQIGRVVAWTETPGHKSPHAAGLASAGLGL